MRSLADARMAFDPLTDVVLAAGAFDDHPRLATFMIFGVHDRDDVRGVWLNQVTVSGALDGVLRVAFSEFDENELVAGVRYLTGSGAMVRSSRDAFLVADVHPIVLQALVKLGVSAVSEVVIRHPNASPAFIEDVLLGVDDSFFIASDVKLSASLVGRLLESEGGRRAVARNHGVSSGVLLALAEGSSPHVVVELLRNPAANAGVVGVVAGRLRGLGSDAAFVGFAGWFDEVKRLCALRDSLDAGSLAWLAGCSSVDVRVAVARHARTPAGVLRVLCEDDDALVRSAAFGNPATPGDAFVGVRWWDEPQRVPFAAASNPSVSVEVLRVLWGVPSFRGLLRDAVVSHPNWVVDGGV
jgi:hypothetical protein